jgi:dTDP-4-amino-4,6-dideoxygalactose transaminase
LMSKNIQTLIHYPVPAHQQEAFREWNDRSYPITESIHQKELSLPISPLQTMEETESICRCIMPACADFTTKCFPVAIISCRASRSCVSPC